MRPSTRPRRSWLRHGARYPGVDVRQAPAERLPFPDGAFDATLAQLVVHLMKDPVAGLTEMRRVTRRDGVIAASVWDHAGGQGPLRLFWDAARLLDPGVDDEPNSPAPAKATWPSCWQLPGCARWRRSHSGCTWSTRRSKLGGTHSRAVSVPPAPTLRASTQTGARSCVRPASGRYLPSRSPSPPWPGRRAACRSGRRPMVATRTREKLYRPRAGHVPGASGPRLAGARASHRQATRTSTDCRR